MRVPRPREDAHAAGQRLRRARDSGPGYAVAFFLVVRGLTENNVCLVRAPSGRVAGPWQLATWHAAFWVSGPVRVWNDFPPTSAPQPGLCHHPGERQLRKSCSFREVFLSPAIHGWAAQDLGAWVDHSCEEHIPFMVSICQVPAPPVGSAHTPEEDGLTHPVPLSSTPTCSWPLLPPELCVCDPLCEPFLTEVSIHDSVLTSTGLQA